MHVRSDVRTPKGSGEQADTPVAPVPNVVLYFRVSTEEQGRKGFSLPEQRRECRARAEALAVESGTAPCIHEFEDHASGELLERPGLTACREFIRRNRVTHFICLDPDRFSRSLNLQLLVADELESRGTRLLFVSHDYQRTAEGKLFFQLRGAISEFEKAKILERTKRGRRGKLASGGIPNHIPTWGYRWNRQEKTLEIDEESAPWVRQIFAWYAGGWSYARIAGELSRLGVRPAMSRVWHRTTIMRMLRNSTYVGRLVLNRWDCEGNGPLRSIPKAQRPRPRTDRHKPPDEWVTVGVPPVIDQPLWEQANARHAGQARLMQRGVGLLSGLCTCGLCGGKLHYMGHRDRRYLRCRNRYPHLLDPAGQTAPRCPWRDVRAEAIEAAVWQRVVAWLSDPEVLRQDGERRRAVATCDMAGADWVETGGHGPCPANHVALLERELMSREQEQARAYHLFVRGLAPAGAEADLARLAEQVRVLTATVSSLRAAGGGLGADGSKPTEFTFGSGSKEGSYSAPEQFASCSEQLSLVQRQQVVRMLIREVVVWPDGHFDLTIACMNIREI